MSYFPLIIFINFLKYFLNNNSTSISPFPIIKEIFNKKPPILTIVVEPVAAIVSLLDI